LLPNNNPIPTSLIAMADVLKRILIIEDEPDIQAVVRLALEAIGGFTVAICNSGYDALKTALSFGPDLILLDVMMPGIDGPTTLQTLRASAALEATPVIFMTAKAQPQEIASYKALGALDVIPKPFDPIALPEKLTTIWQRYVPRTKSAHQQYEELRANYVSNLSDKLGRIADTWDILERNGWDVDIAHSLHVLAHSLAGSGATFGFATISKPAHDLELLVMRLLSRSTLPSSEQLSQVGEAIAALKHSYYVVQLTSLNETPSVPAPQHQVVGTAGTVRTVSPSPSTTLAPEAADDGQANQRIYLLSEDLDFAQDLATQIGVFGYILTCFASLDELAQTIPVATPVTLMVDGKQLGRINGSIRSAIPPGQAGIPIVVLSAVNDLDMCLQAVRAGGDAFFTIPINISGLIDKLDSLIEHQAPEPYRILIVDDEPELSEYHALILRQAGIVASVLTNPLLILRELVDFRPDMVLMDMYMPQCNGLELASVIRQQEAYVSLPIVFLSSEANLDLQLEAMHFGGDDFLTKPIHPDQLVSAVTSRVRRSQAMRSLMVRDSLTGLFKHTVIKELLEIEMSRAKRHGTQLVFAMIDIDHFKSVNDTYGHATGDRVIKSLSRLLQQRLRKSDVIGRYGGEEFAIILPNTDGPRARKVLDELRSGFARIRQQSGEAAFFNTFSCGIAEYPGCPDAHNLIDTADRALYSAKRAGRNRVILATY
jgi:diguanylate cyclase (GGDEF)-like protein